MSRCLVCAAALLAGCGGAIAPQTENADGSIPGALASDASTRDSSSDRLQPHDGQVLSAMRLYVIYIGSEAEGGAPNVDSFVSWLLTSSYWGILSQYGVGPGSVQGSIRIPTAQFFPQGTANDGLIGVNDMDILVHDAVHGTSSTPKMTPSADAYLFFLPAGVNISLSDDGRLRTCIDAGGYHAFDSSEPYAVLPPCTLGRSPIAMSHELSEMATDPNPGFGWFSDNDFGMSGGEIADICNEGTLVQGWTLTRLWSNLDTSCVPPLM